MRLASFKLLRPELLIAVSLLAGRLSALPAQVAIAGPRHVPDARSDLRRGLLDARSIRAALHLHVPDSSPLLTRNATEIQSFESALVALGYTPALLALRDTLEAAELALDSALLDQEGAPMAAARLAAQRTQLRERYCAAVPAEPYCEQDPRAPVVPAHSPERRARLGAS